VKNKTHQQEKMQAKTPVLLAPYSAGSLKMKGQELAPKQIMDAFINIEKPFCNKKILPFETKYLVLNNENIDQSLKKIFETTSQALKALKTKFFVMLGGDHSITLPSFQALLATQPNSGLIVFDAHPDLEVHAGIATHEDWLRFLLENNEGANKLNPENLMIIGTRSFSKNESEFILKNKLKVYNPEALRDIQEFTDFAMSVAKNWNSVYVSIDLDVLDPAFCPGVVYPEPGGISTLDLIYMIHRFKRLKNLKAFDIVEANLKIEQRLTTITAAKLLKHVLTE